MSLNFIFAVLRGTPVWVYIVFAVLLRVSLQQLGPNVRSLRRILVIPVFFTGWGLLGLFEPGASAGVIAVSWLPAAILGATIAARIDLPMKVDRARQRVWQPGSIVSLVRNTVLFLGHYLFNVAAILHPSQREMFAALNLAVSGLGAGYFIAWGVRFAQGYVRAPETDLGEVAAGAALGAH